jgi:uncharacterized membrane protein
MIAKRSFLPETLLLLILVLVVVLVLEKHAYTHRWDSRVRLFPMRSAKSYPEGI